LTLIVDDVLDLAQVSLGGDPDLHKVLLAHCFVHLSEMALSVVNMNPLGDSGSDYRNEFDADTLIDLSCALRDSALPS